MKADKLKVKTDRKQEIENAVEYILTNFDYGDVITYKQLEKIIGREVTDIGFMYLITAVKNELIDYGCILSSVLNEGYKVLHPNEISKEVYKKYIKQGVGKFAKGIRVMNSIDQTMLNKEEKEQFTNIDKIINEMYRTSEDNLLKAQFLIGDVKKKLAK